MQDCYIWQLKKSDTYFVINIIMTPVGEGHETIYIS